MYAPEDILLVEAENDELREKLDLAVAGIAKLKSTLVRFVRPRERRRPEVLLALQVLATAEGLPARCERRECRRDGTCHAGDPCDPECGPLWTGSLAGRFSDMAAGIALSALCIEREADAFEAELQARLLDGNARTPASRAGGKARSRRP